MSKWINRQAESSAMVPHSSTGRESRPFLGLSIVISISATHISPTFNSHAVQFETTHTTQKKAVGRRSAHCWEECC
jgi:hypothetical protein